MEEKKSCVEDRTTFGQGMLDYSQYGHNPANPDQNPERNQANFHQFIQPIIPAQTPNMAICQKLHPGGEGP